MQVCGCTLPSPCERCRTNTLPNLQNPFQLPYSPAPAQMGWQCPRCGVVHAPHVASCQCSLRTYVLPNTSVMTAMGPPAKNDYAVS